jgi:uncharacterized protein (UPF0248 family)
MASIPLIPKEEVGKFKFVSHDVLSSDMARKDRFSKLEKAMLLGNNYKGKVIITFETVEGVRKVETTVWEATEDQLMIKSDVMIPIHAIVDVEL